MCNLYYGHISAVALMISQHAPGPYTLMITSAMYTYNITTPYSYIAITLNTIK